MSEGPPEFEIGAEDEIKPVFPVGAEAQQEGEHKAEVMERIATEEKVLQANLVEFDDVSEVIDAKLDDPATPDSMREQIREKYGKIKERINIAGITAYVGALGLLGGAFLAGGHAETLKNNFQVEDWERWSDIAKHLAEGSVDVGMATITIWAIARGLNKYSTDRKERKTYS